MPMLHQPLLTTHSGTFHLDDAFAYAVLRLALGLGEAGQDHTLLRTRDTAVMAKADVVWDVGAMFDPATGRFDHHQRGAPVREDGLPYSAAGLVWRHQGEAAVRALLVPSGSAGLAAAIAAEIDREVVRHIDEIDNGVGPPGDALGLASQVEDCNPPWDSSSVGDQRAEDAAFLRAVDLTADFLRRRVEAVRARLAAEAVVLAAHARPAGARTRSQTALGGAGVRSRAPYLLRRLPGDERQLDGGRDASGAGLLRPAPPAAGGVGRTARHRPCRVLRRVGRGVRARPPLRRAARSRQGAMEMARRAIEAGFGAGGVPRR